MSAAALTLSPVAAGAYTTLIAAPAVTALAAGGVCDDVPQNPTFPLVLLAVSEERQLGGFGTKPGLRTLAEVRLRVYVFTRSDSSRGFQVAQALTDAILAALADPFDISASGYRIPAIFHDSTIPIADSLIAGQKVEELVSDFRLYVEKTS